jgi:hypothetical protein
MTRSARERAVVDADPHGFFWRTKYFYCCVILHKARKVREGRRKVTFCKEFQAESPEALVKLCRKEDAEGISYKIGSPKKVKMLCDSAPKSPKEWVS